jgi:tetraacyldisaccharide 4'-kinase
LDQEYYRKLISGQIGGIGVLLRPLLRILSWFYGVVVYLRNSFYDLGCISIEQVDKPVISVGNITTGGTGKTPLVIYICQYLLSNQKKTSILTRGFMAGSLKKGNARIYMDEPQIFMKSCPGVGVVVLFDRVEGAKKAITTYEAEVLVMDDGFQHRRLGRDVDIVTIDSTEPFGYGKLLPAGLLRESLRGLQRADAAILTRTDQVDDSQLRSIEEKVLNLNKNIIIARTVHSVVGAKFASGEKMSSAELKGNRIFAFCGIGNPGSFMTTITNLGAEVVGEKIYNDHYDYKEDDIYEIFELARQTDSDLILTTQKDWTKIDFLKALHSENALDIGYLKIELKFISGEEKIRRLIEKALAVKI